MTSPRTSHISVPICACFLFVLLLSGAALGAAGNDSQIFKKGLDSFQKNRYPAAIQSFSSLLQKHPDTPLRDMALYYLARAHLKTGNRHKAAQFTKRLMHEFPASYNKGTIDAELLASLDASPKVADAEPSPSPPKANPAPVPQPQPAPQPKQSQPVPAKPAPAKPKALAQPKAEPPKKREEPARVLKQATVKEQQTAKVNVQERSTKKPAAKQEKAPPPKPREKHLAAPADTIGPGTVAAVAMSKITGKGRFSVTLDVSPTTVTGPAGGQVTIPLTITNRGSSAEALTLESGFPSQFAARFAAASAPGTAIDATPLIEPGAAFDATLTVTVPPSSTDGYRFVFPVKVSARGKSTSASARIVASAPLLRAMVTTRNSRIVPGQLAAYTVTLLNAGSAPAGDITVRLHCPPSYQPVEFGAAEFYQSAGMLVVEKLRIAPGEIREFSALFKLSEAAANGEEVVCRADVIDNQLQTKASFLSGRVVAEKR